MFLYVYSFCVHSVVLLKSFFCSFLLLLLIYIMLLLCLLQYQESGVLVLLLRLAQQLYLQNPEELLVILDLLSRLVTFSKVMYSEVGFFWSLN